LVEEKRNAATQLRVGRPWRRALRDSGARTIDDLVVVLPDEFTQHVPSPDWANAATSRSPRSLRPDQSGAPRLATLLPAAQEAVASDEPRERSAVTNAAPCELRQA